MKKFELDLIDLLNLGRLDIARAYAERLIRLGEKTMIVEAVANAQTEATAEQILDVVKDIIMDMED